MKEKRFQHVISYSNNEFCIEGTWLTDCTNPSKSLYDPKEDIIRSPPIFFNDNTFYISFYFDTHHELFKIFIDINDDLKHNFPVSVDLIMKNHNPKNTLYFQSQFCFTPQTKHGIATFNRKTCLEIFSDEGFSFDGFFIFQYSFKHKIPPMNSPPKLNLYSQNLGLINYASKYLYKGTNLFEVKNNCKYAGISNQGATCYLNSVLQALFHIPAFRSLVYQIPIPESDKIQKTMIYNLQKLFAQMETSNSAVSTKDLTISFGWTSTESFRQNDAQELLRVFLESLEKKLKKQIKPQNSSEKSTNNNNENNNNENTANDNNNTNNNEDNINNNNNNDDNEKINECGISELFKFQVKQSIECPKVSFCNSRVDDYLDFAVEVRGCQNLYQSLKKFTLPEKLDSPYSTDKFGPQEAIMYNKFKSLPKVLFIHLKRFEFRQPGITERFASKISSSFQPSNSLTKINDRFEFPTIINFSEFVDQNETENDWVYELFGVLVHSGSASFGHYYAFLRPENTNQWFKFNDSTVNECTEKEAVNDNYGDGSSCASGYMLIYMKKEDLPQLFTETVKPPKDILLTKVSEPEKNPESGAKDDKKDESKIINNSIQSTNEESIFYNSDLFSSNLLQIKIITDENLRDGCDECSLLISPQPSLNNALKDGYSKGKQAQFLFHDSGIILIHRTATEAELFDRVSLFFSQREEKDEPKEAESMNFYSNKKKMNKKFDLYLMNNTEGTMIRKLQSINSQISYFGPNNISVFYRSHDQKIRSSIINIDNYNAYEKDEEEVDNDNGNEEENNEKNSQYFPIMEIDSGVERIIKRVYNATFYLANYIQRVVNGTSIIITKNIESIQTNGCTKTKKKSKNQEKRTKILIFLKFFDFMKQEIRFLKTKKVFHDDPLSILYEDATNFFFPNEPNEHTEQIQFYCKKFSTIYDIACPSKTFKENKIYSGCIIIMQNTNEKVQIDLKDVNLTKSIRNQNFDEEKIKDLKTITEYPQMTTNSLLDYIDTKYNICEAIVSNYDSPRDYLFILRYSFNNEVSTLKRIVAKAAGIDSYDPQNNSIILYGQHLNSKDEPNSSPLTYQTRNTSPINRIFFRFFSETPEAKISQMVPVKVWLENEDLHTTILAPRSGTVKDVIDKIEEEERKKNKEQSKFYEISLDKSGAVLCSIPPTFRISSVTSNCCIHVRIKDDENDSHLKIAVCHTKGINLFVPFYFDVFKEEEFTVTKNRLKEEIQKRSIENESFYQGTSFDQFFESLLISVHRLNKFMYDTMKVIKIQDSSNLFNLLQEDQTSFLFLELPNEKSNNNFHTQTKSHNVIIID